MSTELFHTNNVTTTPHLGQCSDRTLAPLDVEPPAGAPEHPRVPRHPDLDLSRYLDRPPLQPGAPGDTSKDTVRVRTR